ALLLALVLDTVGGLSPAMTRQATMALLVASLIAGAAVTIPKAWTSLRLRSRDINVLMMIAAAGAIAIGQWAEAATVVFLFAVAQALEARTLAGARAARRGRTAL